MGGFLLALLLNAPVFASSKNIMITGYWPPTNAMVQRFSADPTLNPQGWIGKNWKNSGYDIYAYFPVYKNADDQIGSGDFPVDFAATYNDFMKYTEALHPIAIISFGNGSGEWLIEKNFPPYFNQDFLNGQIPSQIQETIQYPIPESLKQNITYYSTLPLGLIAQRVPGSEINSSGDAGNFLCGFISYLGGWYHSQHSKMTDPFYNAMTGFIHTSTTDIQFANEATIETLNAVVETLPKQGE